MGRRNNSRPVIARFAGFILLLAPQRLIARNLPLWQRARNARIASGEYERATHSPFAIRAISKPERIPQPHHGLRDVGLERRARDIGRWDHRDEEFVARPVLPAIAHREGEV